MNAQRHFLGLLVLCLIAAEVAGATQLGDPAPALDIAQWIKGDPVVLEHGKGNNVYVVEFWATWCGPCRTSIPHLTSLQKRFKGKGVTFIGISDETEKEVTPFVMQMGDKMDYTVAIDRNRKTYKAYMQAFQQNGIPHAFVVDQSGAIAWHGHPMSNLDAVLASILDGTYDIAAMKHAEEAVRLLPEFQRLVIHGTDEAKADALGEEIIHKGANNPSLLNRLAWNLLTDPEVRYRNLDMAMQAAQADYDASKGTDASIVDTYARAFYEQGGLDKAIEYQRKAVALAVDKRVAGQLRRTLDQYLEEAASGSP